MFTSLILIIDEDLIGVYRDLDDLYKELLKAGGPAEILYAGFIKNIEVSLREARASLSTSSWLTVAGLLRALIEACSVVMATRFGGHDPSLFLNGAKVTRYLDEVRKFDPGTMQVYDNLSEGYLHPFKLRTGMFLRPTLPKHTLVDFPRLDSYSAINYLNLLSRFSDVKKFVTVVIYKFNQTGNEGLDSAAAEVLDNRNREIEVLIDREIQIVKERMRPEVEFMTRNNL